MTDERLIGLALAAMIWRKIYAAYAAACDSPAAGS